MQVVVCGAEGCGKTHLLSRWVSCRGISVQYCAFTLELTIHAGQDALKVLSRYAARLSVLHW